MVCSATAVTVIFVREPNISISAAENFICKKDILIDRQKLWEDIHVGDMFYWPPGHTVKVNKDAEFVLFSLQHEHNIVFDHIKCKLGA